MWKIFITVFLILMPAYGLCESNTFSVYLMVSADGSLKNEMESYVSRELRSLGDVAVVDGQADYIISITALESTAGRQVTGVALSVVALEVNDPFMAANLIETSVEDGYYKDALLNSITGLVKFPAIHYVQTGPRNSVKELCNQLVASFDAKVLQEERKFNLKTKEYLKNSNQ